MFLLRYLYVVALVLWVGGLVVAGALVAPSVFGVLQAWNQSQGRVLAGQVFGEVLLRLTWLSYAMGGIMFITLTLHRLLGARPLKYGIRVGIMAMMLVMMMITGFYLIPRGRRDPGAGDPGRCPNLPDTDPAAWNSIACTDFRTSCFRSPRIGGLALCWWEARE